MKKLFLLFVFLLSLSALAENATITLDAARDIALTRAGVTAGRALFSKTKLDRDDGKLSWEMEFFADGTEYEIDIDAATGDILDYETETKAWKYGDAKLTETEAQEIAKAEIQGEAILSKIELDKDNGRIVWEIEYVSGGIEYEYKIDANTGEIVKRGTEKDD